MTILKLCLVRRVNDLMGHDRQKINSLFAQPEYRYPWTRVTYQHLGYLSRAAAELFHEMRPDVIVAGDRAARLFAFAVMKSWHHRYPGERFPTRDHAIHFARVSFRSAEPPAVFAAVQQVIGKALYSLRSGTEDRGAAAPGVVFLDGWMIHGSSANLFAQAAVEMGLPANSLTYVTMVGEQMQEGPMEHIVLDPARNEARNNDWHEDDNLSGLIYDTPDGVTPRVNPDLGPARAVRRMASLLIADYYRPFRQALAYGEVVACEHAGSGTVVGQGTLAQTGQVR